MAYARVSSKAPTRPTLRETFARLAPTFDIDGVGEDLSELEAENERDAVARRILRESGEDLSHEEE